MVPDLGHACRQQGLYLPARMKGRYIPPASISDRMRAVRRRGTRCELLLEAALKARGVRVSTHQQVHGCTPDMLIRGIRLAVFVDGDFWHGRKAQEVGMQTLKGTFRGKSRAFWIAKIQRNIGRDFRQTTTLRRRGWSVVRVWERDVLADADGVARRVVRRAARRRTELKRRRDAS